MYIFFYSILLLILLQAISHPSSDAHQDKAWQKVCPLVLRLRSYYEYAQELETVLNEILNTICSPEMTALEHLEKQQVGHSVHTLYMYYCPVHSMHIRLSIRLCLFVCLFVCNQKKKKHLRVKYLCKKGAYCSHQLYTCMSPEMFARSFESYREHYFFSHSCYPGFLGVHYDKKTLPSLQIVRPTVWLNA